MDLQKLAKMSEADIASWVRDNAESFTLISNSELEEVISNRDDWEGKATSLATNVGKLFDFDVGEHSNLNCPVQAANEKLQLEVELKEKRIALKQRLHSTLNDQMLN
ncbi:TPA: hypothetical protein ACN976_003001 [Vibrio campbellii]